MHRSCKGCKLDDDVRHVTWIALRDITVLGCNNIGFVSLCTGEEQNKEALQDVEDETQWDNTANMRLHPTPPPPPQTPLTKGATKPNLMSGTQQLDASSFLSLCLIFNIILFY